MRLLLDTHVVLWGIREPQRLGRTARQAILDAESNLVSVVTFIEVGVKTATSKLRPPDGFDTAVPAERLLPITPEHALALGRLPLHHRDPWDRLLIAQAITEGLTIVTADAAFAAYDVPLVNAAV